MMFSSLLMMVSALPLLVSTCQDYMVAPNEPHTIHPNGDPTQCLEVQGGQFRSGTPVQTFYCNGTPAQEWKISRGTTTVQVDVAPFCLDAGADPHPGVPVKIWQCFPNLPAQTWFYTADNRIALKDTGLCLTRIYPQRVATYTCSDNNFDQVWILDS